jgi:thiosulfate/3-mercaptopyruvate sulfurtransferase
VDVATQFSDPDAPLHYTHPQPQRLADELARLGIAEGEPVVVYDSTSTMWAARLWYLLDWIGVPVRVLDGGLAAWKAAGNSVDVGDVAARTPVPTWTATARRDAWIDKGELESRAADDSRPLVCSLPLGSFTGAQPTRYSRRGRIPGSVSVSSRDLFGADGRLITACEVDEHYAAAGVDDADDEVLLYCGGGISAAAGALALAAIGRRAVRIYDGSLEEWSADPRSPLETG